MNENCCVILWEKTQNSFFSGRIMIYYIIFCVSVLLYKLERWRGGAGGANNSTIFIRRDGCERWPCRRWMFDDDVALQRKTKPGENSSGKIIYYYYNYNNILYFILFYFFSFQFWASSRKVGRRRREREKKNSLLAFSATWIHRLKVYNPCVCTNLKKNKKKKVLFIFFLLQLFYF